MMEYEQAIQQAIDYIESHLHEPFSIEEIGKHTGFSTFHFHRIFQSTVGMTVLEYRRMRCLAHAAVALLHSDERIIDIALDYHFGSQEAFTRAFKKVYQLPPGQYRKVMRKIIWKKEESRLNHQDMNGWFLSGSDPYHYEIGIDHKVIHQGKASGYLRSVTVKDGTEFATLMQQFKAKRYIGKRVRLSCFLKTKNVEVFSGLWMRVDNANSDVLQFDNMSNRPVVGTTNWNRYSIVLDVPLESDVISFGVLLNGKGHVWADQFTFEEVDESVDTTNMEFHSELLEEPTNLSFEEEIG